MGVLKVGVFGLHRGEYAGGQALGRRARLVEAAGFDSIWVGDHIVMPDSPTNGRGSGLDMPRLEAVVALTYIAAHTARVRLATGVIVLPQRHPLLLAKQLASLDTLSGGRLIVGVGVGWLEPELRAMGVSMDERGPRMDEYLAAMRALWSEERPSYHGRYVAFSGLSARPLPPQQPHPPIIVGGSSPPAYRRAIEQANGWYGFSLDVEAAARALAGLRRAAERSERGAGLGELEITITPPPGTVDQSTAERYAALGVHRLALLPPDLAEPKLEQFVTETAAALIGRQ